MTQRRPNLWVIAGPNGAGKSTLVERFSIDSKLPVVNPDNIAKELAGPHKELAAGKLAIQERNRLLKQKVNFAFETTLTGKNELNFMRKAKAEGYKVNLLFVGIPSPNVSLMRVAARVARGGHNVPKEDIFRRYNRSMTNLLDAITVSERYYIFDNTTKQAKLLASKSHGRVKHNVKSLPGWFKDVAANAPELAPKVPRVLQIDDELEP